METFHYDNCADIIVDIEDTAFLSNLTKNSKTRTISRDGWSKKINTKDIKISPSTYWRIGGYDRQFEGNDFYCYLCNYAGITPSKCRCKEYFTIEENIENIKIARKNYLFSVIDSYFSDILPLLKVMKITDAFVDKILYKKGKYDERILTVYYPPAFDYRDDYKVTTDIKNHLIKMLTYETTT